MLMHLWLLLFCNSTKASTSSLLSPPGFSETSIHAPSSKEDNPDLVVKVLILFKYVSHTKQKWKKTLLINDLLLDLHHFHFAVLKINKTRHKITTMIVITCTCA